MNAIVVVCFVDPTNVACFVGLALRPTCVNPPIYLCTNALLGYFVSHKYFIGSLTRVLYLVLYLLLHSGLV